MRNFLYKSMMLKYKEQSYRVQERVRITLSLVYIISPLITLMLFVLAIIQGYGFAHPTVLAVMGILVMLIIVVFLIKSGHSRIGANVLIMTVNIAVWFILISGKDRGDLVRVLNTINYLFALIVLSAAIMPKMFIGIYTSINTILIVLVGFYFSSIEIITPLQRNDFILDGVISIVITGIVLYVIARVGEKDKLVLSNSLEENKEYSNNIKKILEQTQDAAAKLATTTEQMSAATDNFSDNAQTQASTIEEITATVEEVSAGEESVYNMAQQQVKLTEKANSDMQNLYEIVYGVDSQMKSALTIRDMLNDTVQKISSEIKDTLESMSSATSTFKDVETTVNLIQDISDQINLLSLNAAIEAARAGDHGRGFAVVADEIGKLAVNTSDNVSTINRLFAASNGEIERASKNLENFTESLKTMISGISDLSEKIDEVVALAQQDMDLNIQTRESLQSVLDEASNIVSATNEQKTAFSEVTKSISVISKSTQEIAGGAEELHSTSDELAKTAQGMMILSSSVDKKDKEDTDVVEEDLTEEEKSTFGL